MKIIFGDIDGVLNSIQYDRLRMDEQGNIDETRLALLKRIVEATQAVIVLSSSWRKHWEKNHSLCDSIGREIDTQFSKYQLTIYDKIPCLPGNNRAEEIRLWLMQNKEISSFVILDDVFSGFLGDLQDRLLRTNPRIGRGLEERHVEQAIVLLNI